LTPSKPTIKAYRAWCLQQDYLRQLSSGIFKDVGLEGVDERVAKVIMGVFLMPAILSRIEAPKIDHIDYQIGSLIDKQSKNLYKIRNLQNKLFR